MLKITTDYKKKWLSKCITAFLHPFILKTKGKDYLELKISDGNAVQKSAYGAQT